VARIVVVGRMRMKGMRGGSCSLRKMDKVSDDDGEKGRD